MTSLNAEKHSENEPIDVVVYMNDNTGVMLKVSHDTRADQLFEMVLKEMKIGGNLGELYRKTFSLWLVSDLLELQLKPTHIPFKLVCFWEEMLEKYVQCSEEDMQRDEPMIMFQRNVYLEKSSDLEAKDDQLLSLLYHEALNKNLHGKYLLEVDAAEDCAVVQAFIMEKSGHDNVGSTSFFFDNLKKMMPAKYCGRHWLWKKSQNPEVRLSNLFEAKKKSFIKPSLQELYKSYLTHCIKLPTYGGAFLNGQVECPSKRFDIPIYMCVSLEALCVICKQEHTLVASIPLELLSWQYAESNKRNDKNVLPCLFLLFPQKENSAEVNKLFQLFSKSALLADNLLDTLIALKKSKSSADKSNLSIYVDDKRVATAVFDADGQKLRSCIKLPTKSTLEPSAV